MVAITEGRSEPGIILTRRSMHMKIHPGEAAFPGGKQDPEDTSLFATALREANEEVGLHSSDFRLLGQLDQRVTRTDIKVTPFVGVVHENVDLVPNDGELDCIYTVPLSFFCEPANMQVTEKPYRGKMQKVPYFEYGDHGIWGVTAMMIVDLVNVVFDAGLSVEGQ